MTKKVNDIRVRIAPSPTGFAHVGTGYAALFNYAFARKHKGKFIVRIEDTDTKRNVKEATEAILDSLKWLGLDWDESIDKGGPYKPYLQSERLDTYKKWMKILLESDAAYEDDGAIRFRNPDDDVGWSDLVRGKIVFPSDQITDFVIQKSDGFPTYNFAVVVDDIEMKISHVIRGEEHISNTPRQLVLYKAFGIDPPEFAHLPTLRNKDRKKLSKRRDPVDLEKYKKEGYLPEALLNFLMLLGWSHPNEKEIFPLEEFVELFSLDRIRKAGPVFNTEKLDWMNGEYIKRCSDSELSELIFDYYKGKYDKEMIGKTTPLVKERINKLSEYETMAGFFFDRPKVELKLFGENYKEHLTEAANVLELVEQWEKGVIDKALLDLVKKQGFKTGDFFMDLRIAITGSKVTPPINDSIAIMEKGEVIVRLKL